MPRKLVVANRSIADLGEVYKNVRKHSVTQINKLKKSIEEFGFNVPLLIDKNLSVISGSARLEAAKQLGMIELPTIQIEHLTDEQIRAFRIADNRLAEEATWDNKLLKSEFLVLSELGLDLTLTGFEIPEIDLIINFDELPGKEEPNQMDELPDDEEVEKRVKLGDIYSLGEHKVICADALQFRSYQYLMGCEKAQVVFTDLPYNVKIQNFVTTNKKHGEFVQASGEMNQPEYTDFMKKAMKNLVCFSKDGSIHFHCMDWRHIPEILEAGDSVYSELKNLCVWDKGNGGMGTLYRSQHELVFVFKNGTAPHINNVELGKHGRYRTNVWKYSGMHASNPEASELLKLHPTVKPVAMIMDAIMDCSMPKGIVLDSFGGSGSTLLAAEKTKRKARLIELDPHYCDVIIHRFEKLTQKKATLIKNVFEVQNA